MTAYVGSAAKKTVTVGTVLAATLTGLTNGASYTFRVHALNQYRSRTELRGVHAGRAGDRPRRTHHRQAAPAATPG